MAASVSSTKIKEALIRVVDELSPERRAELLEFALFMQTRQSQEPAEREKLTSPLPETPAQHAYPLQGSVLRYDDPFAPVADTDWESLQ